MPVGELISTIHEYEVVSAITWFVMLLDNLPLINDPLFLLDNEKFIHDEWLLFLILSSQFLLKILQDYFCYFITAIPWPIVYNDKFVVVIALLNYRVQARSQFCQGVVELVDDDAEPVLGMSVRSRCWFVSGGLITGFLDERGVDEVQLVRI